jgi:hypothetical protein
VRAAITFEVLGVALPGGEPTVVVQLLGQVTVWLHVVVVRLLPWPSSVSVVAGNELLLNAFRVQFDWPQVVGVVAVMAMVAV